MGVITKEMVLFVDNAEKTEMQDATLAFEYEFELSMAKATRYYDTILFAIELFTVEKLLSDYF